MTKTGLIFWQNRFLVWRGACFGYFSSVLHTCEYPMTNFLAVYEFFVANHPCWVTAYFAKGVLEEALAVSWFCCMSTLDWGTLHVDQPLWTVLTRQGTLRLFLQYVCLWRLRCCRSSLLFAKCGYSYCFNQTIGYPRPCLKARFFLGSWACD